MINIVIKTEGKKILDRVNLKDTTFLENCAVIRRLEEIKLLLLKIEYKNDYEIYEKED